MSLKFQTLVTLVLPLVFAGSCKKKENPEPLVTMTLPYSGTTYNSGDTIFIQADISDNESPISVTIKLLNAAYIPVDHQESVSFDASSFHLSFSYVISNEYLETGNYFITLSVSDGDNTRNEFRDIFIYEIPKSVKGVYFLTRPDSSHLDVYKLDSAGLPDLRFNFTGDYTGSVMDSRYKRLHVAGYATGAYHQFDPEAAAEVYSLPPYNTSLPSYTGIFLAHHLAFVSYYDGRIRAFDKSGIVRFNSQQPVYYVPGALCVNDEYVFAEAYYPSALQNRLVVINYPSGAPRQEYNLNADIISMTSTDNNFITLFCNLNADGKIFSYHVPSNSVSDLRTLYGNLIFSALATDNDRFAIGTSNGLYSYQLSNNNFFPVHTGESVNALDYDDVNGILYAVSGTKIRTYAFPSSTVLNTIVSQDPVVAVRLLYSK